MIPVLSVLVLWLSKQNVTGFSPTKTGLVRTLYSGQHQRRPTALTSFVTEAQTLFSDLVGNSIGGSKKRDGDKSVRNFFQAWNARDFDTLVAQFDDDCVFEDTSYFDIFVGKDAINRHFRLLADAKKNVQFVLDDFVSDVNAKAAVLYHLENGGDYVPNSRHIVFFNLDPKSGLITSVIDNVEPAAKTGNADLAIVSLVSKLSASQVPKEARSSALRPASDKITPPERYFDAWSRRDMEAAEALFDENCNYEDTVFPQVFENREALAKHLQLCAAAFPRTFTFVVDDIADGGDAFGARWHAENEGKQVIFTRGLSIYKIDKKSGLIRSGIDQIEPAVFKLGGVKNFAESMKNKLEDEPIRLVPLAVWAAYMYIVFLSEGILPGANALQLEQRTWEEVRDLSLNFFFVSPLLNLPFSPEVHPVLEGVFNLLLSWAALFAGFLSDDRKDKPNLFPMVPAVAGMQFLTSAFLLPYLTLRSRETLVEGEKVCTEDLDFPAQVLESRALGPFLGVVGAGAILWGAVARMSDFGGLEARMASFWQLMSIDRVGSSFLVDLAIFAAFQGWLVDDDLKRRGVADDELGSLRKAVKFVPFFGLAAYMFLRPDFLSNDPESI